MIEESSSGELVMVSAQECDRKDMVHTSGAEGLLCGHLNVLVPFGSEALFLVAGCVALNDARRAA